MTWLTAVGSIGTLLAALVALIVWVGTVRDKRRALAVAVSAWAERYVASQTSDPWRRPKSYRVYVRNGSLEPIFGVVVGPPGQTMAELATGGAHLVPPGATIPVESHIAAGYLDDLPAPMTVIFSDANGREWIRDHGKVHRHGKHRWLGQRQAWWDGLES